MKAAPSGLVLLPLCGLVAFPGTTVTLSIPAGAVKAGDMVGLTFRLPTGKLATVGCLASVQVHDDSSGCSKSSVISCDATSRIRVIDMIEREEERPDIDIFQTI